MDAAEADLDIKLQKISGDLLADFDRSLPVFLRKSDGHGGSRVRSLVRSQEQTRLTAKLLDPFQELPQLLDPYLSKWVPMLSVAYLEHLQSRRRAHRSSGKSDLLIPMGQAICRLLYALCKIRGEKVIVHFLNVEAKYLELLLSAVEEAEQSEMGSSGWSWEQQYIVLLWLSHLLLAPFDLSTISSVDTSDLVVPEIAGLTWPQGLPGIAIRVVPLAIKYLATSGRERDAAKALLVRISMRRDMQKLGLLESLIRWALTSLRSQQDKPADTPYLHLGTLSFLAGILQSSAETSDLDRYLAPIFQTVHGLAVDEAGNASQGIVTFAVARKSIIKILRTVVVSLLRKTRQDMESTEMTETAISYLLESVADNDTPVRFAASKSLSIITLKLDPEMASQVVEAVLESLNRNVLWSRPPVESGEKPIRDLAAVNHLEWHGLMLTLSHLLYRRSPPAEQLSDIVHALLLGLSFEQRGPSGASIGANVRDAACFGIWALARRYSTKELLAVPTQSVYAAKAHPAAGSIIQVLGTELVVTGSLDPAGNIRRGASAALQELIGRHPDTVEEGISVVQTVDYHAVARRSRAIGQVALGATRLSSQYGDALIDGLLGWRGIGDLSAPSRRSAGEAFGRLTAELGRRVEGGAVSRMQASIELVARRLSQLEKRQVEERHGLLLCFASLLDELPEQLRSSPTTRSSVNTLASETLNSIRRLLVDCKSTTYRRPELIAEAASVLGVSAMPLLQMSADQSLPLDSLHTGQALLGPDHFEDCLKVALTADSAEGSADVEAFTADLAAVIPVWLGRHERETMEPAAAAALALLVFSTQENRAQTLRGWAELIRQRPGSRAATHGNGYFFTLAMAQPLAEKGTDGSSPDVVCKALCERWQEDTEIETRVAILQSLTRSRLLQDKPLSFLDILCDGLNDYTANARGDVGSHVRVQALRAVCSLRRDSTKSERGLEEPVTRLIYGTLRLAGEKLDRIRPEAQAALALLLREKPRQDFLSLTFSSRLYFQSLLELHYSGALLPDVASIAKQDAKSWMAHLLAGFVTSADTGNEDLVIDSRTALCNFCASSLENLRLVCSALIANLKTYHGQDRVIVPTLEVIAFLFHAGLFQQAADKAHGVDLRSLCLQTQKAGYKTGNVKKILACIKVYGGVAGMSERQEDDAVGEARKRLGALMFHPWPRVRSAVVDELWGVLGDDDGESEEEDGEEAKNERGVGAERLSGVDWAKADKGQVKTLIRELRLE